MSKPDCLTCGLCCIAPFEQAAFANVGHEDERRMGKRLVRLHVLHPTTLDRLAAALDSSTLTAHGAIKTKQMLPKRGPLAKYELCACHFLQGTALVDVRCSIYEKRPEVCRKAVRPGDRVCREVRRKVRAQLEESDG